MSAGMLLAVVLAGGLGALCRWAWGQTLAINLLGSLLAGVLVAFSGPRVGVVATGFLGGFTTFSTAMVEHIDEPDPRRAWGRTVAMLGGCLIAAFLGNAIGLVIRQV